MHAWRIALVVVVAGGLVAGCADGAPPERSASETSKPPAQAQPVVAFDDGFGIVYVMNLNGSGLEPISPTGPNPAADGVYSADAAVSPDGREVVYSGKDGLTKYTLSSGATHLIRADALAGGPAYSADGKRIAFLSGRTIYVMNSDGSNARAVVSGETPDDMEFTPTGDELIYSKNGYLVQIPIAGGEPRTVLRDRFFNSDPEYSPDGSTLVFASNRGGNNGSELYAMPAKGGEITSLTQTYAVDPTFLPDGSRILYTRAVDSTKKPVNDLESSRQSQVASMNPDGTDQRPLTPPNKAAQKPSAGG